MPARKRFPPILEPPFPPTHFTREQAWEAVLKVVRERMEREAHERAKADAPPNAAAEAGSPPLGRKQHRAAGGEAAA